MSRWIARFVLTAAALSPAIAQAQEREFCADRPGLGTPACTLAPGSAMLELGAINWDRTRDRVTIEDEVTLGDALVRVGVSETAEVQFGLTAHVIRRERDRSTGAVERASGVGDGTIALRQGLSGPGGPIAVQAFVTVPLARRSVGSGEWSGGVLLPMSFDLGSGFELGLTPEVDLAADEDARGHHLAWGGVLGLSRRLGENLTVAGEAAAFRDEDPGGHATDARVAASLAWQVGKRLQIDIEADAGLSAAAPDHTLALGLAWQFR